MEPTWLQTTWFILIGVLLAGYAVLDGFDLGVGMLHPLARDDEERRTFLNAIGPIWDGNEVWLITFGGALFAAFPYAYATVFEGLYTAVMLLLFALIFRAVSIEFRSKLQTPAWRRAWDWGFFVSSFLATLLFGVAVGNGILGLPLTPAGGFSPAFSFFDLLNPYGILVGLLSLSLFAMHGALYLHLKVPFGPLHERLRGWMWHTWGIFLVCYILTTMYTLIAVGRAVPNFAQFPWAALLVVANVLAIANIPRAVYADRPGQAFLSSCATILLLVALFGLAQWPYLVPARDPSLAGWTVASAASSPKTLGVMLVVALVGMPLVLAYTAVVYWTFRGRVRLEGQGY
ncbi:MAG: cytochrome d ubiquinol oxidase subunit II [Candidatus Latescibacterota bacterium]